jgi:O-antigen/teichoic acid export membrane protein
MGQRFNRAAMGFLTDFGGQLIGTLVGFVATPIILSLTSQSLYGFWVTSLSVVGLLGIIDLGMSVSLTQRVASLGIQPEGRALSRLASSAFLFLLLVSLLFGELGWAVSLLFPGWFNVPPDKIHDVVLTFRLLVLSGMITTLMGTFGAIVYAIQRMFVINVVTLVVSLSSIVLSIALLTWGFGLPALALANLVTALAGGLAHLWIAKAYCPQLEIRLRHVNRSDLQRLLSFAGYSQLTKLANTVQLMADSPIIASALGSAEVTRYAFTSKVPMLFSTVVASKPPLALMPALSEMFGQNDTERLRRAFVMLAHYSVRLGFIFATFVAVANKQFVSLWVGQENFGGALLNVVFVYWALQETFYRMTTILVYASGDLRSWAFVSLAEAGLNVLASVILVRYMGLAGVALGTSIGKTFTTAPFVPYWICRKLGIPIRAFVWHGVFRPAIRCFPTVLITAVFAAMLFPYYQGWLWIAAVGLVAGITNVLTFELVYFVTLTDVPFRVRLQRIMKLEYNASDCSWLRKTS